MPTLQDVKNVFAKYIYLSNTNVVDAVLGAAIANQLPGPPICLYLIGPPGSGKTELLNGLEGYHRTYHPSKITPNTLMSGYVEKGENKKIKGKNDHSLLVRLTEQGKNILVFKDFTTILAMPHESRQVIIGQFREIADGRYVGDSGFGKEGNVIWRGKMAIMAGVTNAIDELGSVNSILGERFLCFRMHGEPLDEVYGRVLESTVDLDAMHGDFEAVIHDYMVPFDLNCTEVPMEPGISKRLKHLAAFISHTRTGITRNFKDEVVTPPEREGFGRISRQLYIYGSGIALARGVDTIDYEVYRLIKKVARDTVPQWRSMLLQTIFMCPLGLTVKDLAKATGIPNRTMYRHIEDLELCGTLKHVTSIVIGKDRWNTRRFYLSTELSDHIEQSGVFVCDYVE